MALALALVTGPDVVVVDEPTTGLDPDTTRALLESLAGLAASGVALVLLTHDHDLARALAHEALAVRGGRVEAQGPAAEVLDVPGRPPMADPAPATTHPRLRARGLTVVTGDGRAILDGVDLDADAGAAVAVIGPSGAGKTTLARALAGLAVARSGVVEVRGTVLRPDALDRDRHGRRAVQYIHQDPRSTFAPHRAVLEQVARPATRLRGRDAGAARAEAVEVLGTLAVDEATAGRRPRALSGGQLQRAAIARALLARPAVIVADEATSALDADHRDELVAVLDGVRREHGATLVLVSHDLELVGEVAGTTVVLDAGRVVDRGPTAEVLARTAPRVVAGRR
jgi:peptide/nickel transport system ATP-binding protein